jgi:hypothetical protein
MGKRGSSAKIIKKVLKGSALTSTFDQLLGKGASDFNVVLEKNEKLKLRATSIMKTMAMFANSKLMAAYVNEVNSINKWISDNADATDTLFDQSDVNILSKEEDRKKFTDRYNEMKNSELIGIFVHICRVLHPYRAHIGDFDALSHSFLMDTAINIKPFVFSNVDFVYLHTQSVGKAVDEKQITSIRKFLMITIHKLYKESLAIVELKNSPDIDIDHMVEVLIGEIGKLKTQMKAHRCDDAFKKLFDSTDILKKNFAGYFQDMLRTKDRTIILQDYVIDVATEDSEMSPVVLGQFRKIISMIITNGKGKIDANPKIKAMIDSLTNTVDELSGVVDKSVGGSGDTPDVTMKNFEDDAAEEQLDKARNTLNNIVNQISNIGGDSDDDSDGESDGESDGDSNGDSEETTECLEAATKAADDASKEDSPEEPKGGVSEISEGLDEVVIE